MLLSGRVSERRIFVLRRVILPKATRTNLITRRRRIGERPKSAAFARIGRLVSISLHLLDWRAYRISTTLSPPFNAASTFDQTSTKASSNAGVRQLPSRTHTNCRLSFGLLARYRKSSSLLMITRPFFIAYWQSWASKALPRSASSTCSQSTPFLRGQLPVLWVVDCQQEISRSVKDNMIGLACNVVDRG